MPGSFDIIVIGTYFFDEIYVGLTQFPEPGREIYGQDLVVTPGATTITVAALARLGVNAGWISCFGDDYYSQYILQQAGALDINLSLVRQLDRPYRQVTTSLPFEGERAFITLSDPEPDDMAEYIVSALAGCDFGHLHFAWLPAADYLPVFELARRKGATISADCQDVPILQEPDAARQMIGQLDLFLPNAREARIVAERDSTQRAIERMARWVDLLVVKDGEHGAWIAENGTVSHIAAIPASTVIDTTGAGDCFNAGFLLGHVVEHRSVQTSAACGNICAGNSVQGVGGTANLVSRRELEELYQAHYPANGPLVFP